MILVFLYATDGVGVGISFLKSIWLKIEEL